MSITAAEVKALRIQTGAGMMDCKRALEESEGNTEKAVEILRLKGQKVAAKRSDREASDGVILSGVSKDGKTGLVMSLNCETDFVAQNADFISLTQTLIDLAIADSCESKDELLAKKFPGSDITVADRIIDETGKIGELIEIGGFNISKGETVASYIPPTEYFPSIVSHGSFWICFNPRETRSFSLSKLKIFTSISCPRAKTSDGLVTLDHEMSVICKRPSKPPRSTKAP